VAIAGLILAWLIYHRQLISSAAIARAMEPIPTALTNKYYLDYLYEDVIVGTLFYRGLALVMALFDSYVIDGVVNGVARVTRQLGDGVRRVQTGDLQAYGAVFVGGVIVILGVIFLIGRM
jgi:NADH-quinone oxidoreductase subunit L